MNKKQKDIEMFGSNNEGKYVLSNVLGLVAFIIAIVGIIIKWLM